MTPAPPSNRRLAMLLAGLAMFGPFSIDASIGCALSHDLTTLLVFRALQGVTAGVGVIVGRAVIRDLYHGADAQRLMSQVSMIFGIAPAIAPIIGGWILLGGGDWPLIFWFLVVFALVLLAATGKWLPETHPVEARTPLSTRALLRSYLQMGTNPRLLRLAAAGAFNFSGIFLYIASAPVFVMQHLQLGEGGFAWLFIPTIGGMTTGSFLSGRMAGRMTAARQVGIGFSLCAVSALVNLAYVLAVGQIALPWAVLPIFIGGVGMALIFPILALAVLDMYPHQRGLASSMQMFLQLMINTVVAGVVSPMLSHTPLHLALGYAGFFAIGASFWFWERRCERRREAAAALA